MDHLVHENNQEKNQQAEYANDEKNPNINLDSENINSEQSNKKRKNKKRNQNTNNNNNNNNFPETPEKNIIESPSPPKNIIISPDNLLKEGKLN
jgi:hypothetical protein